MNNSSFQQNVLPLKNELYRLALRITRNAEDAEDAVQETMLKVWNRRQQWPEIENLEAYCMTICRNLALDKIKLMQNQSASLDDAPHDTPDASYSSNPEAMAVGKDTLEVVRQLIDRLPEKQRACMQLRDIEGKSYKEIAAVLQITEEQVKINIFRARQTVRQKYLSTQQYGL